MFTISRDSTEYVLTFLVDKVACFFSFIIYYQMDRLFFRADYLPNEIPIPETLKVIYCSPHQGVTMEGSGCAPTSPVHNRLVKKPLINGVD